MAESGEQFLHRKDPKLHLTKSVEHEQARRKKAGESVSQKPAEKIANFLDVIKKTHMEHRSDPEVMRKIKDYYYGQYLIKPDDVPQEYWDLQGEIAVNEGRKGDLLNLGVTIEETIEKDKAGEEIIKRRYKYPKNIQEQAIRTIITSQKENLGQWIDYLTSFDAPYPLWAKYWIFRSIVRMGKFEKTEDGKARFGNRGKDTVSPFPEINPRALANTISAMEKNLQAKGEKKPIENLSKMLSDLDFEKLLNTEDFSKLYAQFLIELPQYSTEGLKEIRGKWIKYKQGSDPKKLVNSLKDHPLEWCTADYNAAKAQLEDGDFYVYYSLDRNGQPTIPRIAIRMKGNNIGEVRGILHNQNLDSYMVGVVDKKLEEFGDKGLAYRKKVRDMHRLSAIEQKTRSGQELNLDEIVFLYEIYAPIEGFGFDRDPRINEILYKRNAFSDYEIIASSEGHKESSWVKDRKEGYEQLMMLRDIEQKTEKGQQLTSEEINFLYRIPYKLHTGYFDSNHYGYYHSLSNKITSALRRYFGTIEEKTKEKRPLTTEELNFLYGVDIASILGFSSDMESRREQLRRKRRPVEDVASMLGYNTGQIARLAEEITKESRVYLGRLSRGIFDFLSKYNVEHIYTSFPEGKIEIQYLEVGGKSKAQLISELKQANVDMPGSIVRIFGKTDFHTSPTRRKVRVVKLKIKDLGLLGGGGAIDEIYEKAESLGLELCSPEVAVYQRIKDVNQSSQRPYFIPTEEILDIHDNSIVFILEKAGRQSIKLFDWYADPDREDRDWNPNDEFLFAMR